MSQYNAKQWSVDEIIKTNMVFVIPDYQRGYRWSKTEVTDLLDDIQDIVQDDKNPQEIKRICSERSYCLQPITFDTKDEENGRMTVVDGQQRLTTIYLILRYIENRISATDPSVLQELDIDPNEYCKHYELEYDNPTRESVFTNVKQNLEAISEENIDSYYITSAYSEIKKWGDGKKIFKLIQFAVKVIYGTSIIWYEIDQDIDGTASDYFSKINTGKIPLTNSELIKANLMLDEYCVEIIDESMIYGASEKEKLKNIAVQKDLLTTRLRNERIKISRQWDEIENFLRNDEFWYFITEASDEYEDTRIDYIFDIVAKKLFPEVSLSKDSDGYASFMASNKERGTFTIIARYLNENRMSVMGDMPIGLKVWKMAWDTYMVFREWFENREWYHFIGYLIGIEGGCDARDLLELFTDKVHTSKDQIRKTLANKIMERVKLKIDVSGKPIVRSKDEYINYLNNLNYNSTSSEIVDILLLFNVISVLSDSLNGVNSSRDTYFPFSRYKKEKWNKEHIHSKADGESFTKNAAEDFVDYLNEMLNRMKREKAKNPDRLSLEEAIKNFNDKKDEQIASGSTNDEAIRFAAQDTAQMIANSFSSDLEDEQLNGIGNMALLDEVTNKSYQNAPFFMKRMIIGDIVRGKKPGVSRFIPFCTRNVFDKAYTMHPSNMLHWTKEDCKDYIDVIADTICNYFSVKGDNRI